MFGQQGLENNNYDPFSSYATINIREYAANENREALYTLVFQSSRCEDNFSNKAFFNTRTYIIDYVEGCFL